VPGRSERRSDRAAGCPREAILGRLAAAEFQLEALAELDAGRLRLGSFATASATLTALAIAAFAEAHPGIELRLVEGRSNENVFLATHAWLTPAPAVAPMRAILRRVARDLALDSSHGDRGAAVDGGGALVPREVLGQA
jgi:hypothetical protein